MKVFRGPDSGLRPSLREEGCRGNWHTGRVQWIARVCYREVIYDTRMTAVNHKFGRCQRIRWMGILRNGCNQKITRQFCHIIEICFNIFFGITASSILLGSAR
jgi:hypothetical protein